MVIDVGQIIYEHPVMIALQDDPVLPGGDTGAQILDHARAIRPPVDQIADMDNRGRAMFRNVAGNPGMDAEQLFKMAVNVTDGIGSHAGLLMDGPGGAAPGPPGYLETDERARGAFWVKPRIAGP
jgi:hypothetical protein